MTAHPGAPGASPEASGAAPSGSSDGDMPAAVAGPIPLPNDLPTVPPALLHARHITDAHEVLVLSYTSDLQFFESTCLADALASTGRVTIVRDADKGVPASETRLAGSRYLDVPVRCRSGGAFHPKLVVIASPARAVAAIGSGNVTASGWHYNAELWTVVIGEGDTWPVAFADLAAWLVDLPDFLLIDDFGAQRLRDVAAMLSGRQYSGGPVLAHNLQHPILDQLPSGPARALGVASPFLDVQAAALKAVRARLSPRSLNVALTRGAAFDAEALADVLEAPQPNAPGATAAAAPINSPKYHHGKLLEWEWNDGSGGALVGSANCTAAAMLLTTGSKHGNCELGLIVADLGVRDLMPETGEPLDRAGLAEHAAAGPDVPSDRASAKPFLARALRAPAGLQLTVLGVSGPALATAQAVWNGEAHAVSTDPNDGAQGFAYVPASAGDLVRIRFADGQETAPVPVTDPDRVLIRLQKPSPLEQHTLASVLADPSLAQELLDALEQLAAVRPRTASGGSAGDRTPAQWLEEWQMAASAAVGSSLVALALGTELAQGDPGTGNLGREGTLGIDIPASGELGDVDVDEDADLDELLGAELAAAEEHETERERRRAERHRKHVVRLLAERASTAAAWQLPAQISLLRVLMVAVASGLFHDEPWAPTVASLARSVVRPATVDEDSEPSLSTVSSSQGDTATSEGARDAARALEARRIAIGTVCLAMIASEHQLRTEAWSDLVEFRKVREVLPDTADGVDPDLVRAYALGLDRLLGVSMSAKGILDGLEHLLASPLRRLADALSSESTTVEATGTRTLRVTGKGQARAIAYSTLQKAQSLGPLTVVADTPAGHAVLSWAQPNLIEVLWSAQGGHGRHLRLPMGLGMAMSGQAKPLARWRRGELPAEVRVLLEQAGLTCAYLD